MFLFEEKYREKNPPNALSLSNQSRGILRNAHGTEKKLKFYKPGGRELAKGGKGSFNEKEPKFRKVNIHVLSHIRRKSRESESRHLLASHHIKLGMRHKLINNLTCHFPKEIRHFL